MQHEQKPRTWTMFLMRIFRTILYLFVFNVQYLIWTYSNYDVLTIYLGCAFVLLAAYLPVFLIPQKILEYEQIENEKPTENKYAIMMSMCETIFSGLILSRIRFFIREKYIYNLPFLQGLMLLCMDLGSYFIRNAVVFLHPKYFIPAISLILILFMYLLAIFTNAADISIIILCFIVFFHQSLKVLTDNENIPPKANLAGTTLGSIIILALQEMHPEINIHVAEIVMLLLNMFSIMSVLDSSQ